MPSENVGVLHTVWCSGGTSRSQLDAAAATAAELGLELALVEYQYTTAFDLGTVSFRVVDPSAAEEVVRVKAEVRDPSNVCCCVYRLSIVAVEVVHGLRADDNIEEPTRPRNCPR